MSQDTQGNDAWSGMGIGWGITSTLIAGIVTLGGLGYIIDRLAGTRTVFQPVGMVIGGGLGIYVVYLRYGKGDRDEG